MALVRYGLPAVLLLAGVGFFVLDPDDNGVEGWALFTGIGLSVLLLNTLHRMGVTGDVSREREEEAREYFTEHGSWPDEEEPRGARKWRLPENVATPESEAAEAREARETDSPR